MPVQEEKPCKAQGKICGDPGSIFGDGLKDVSRRRVQAARKQARNYYSL